MRKSANSLLSPLAAAAALLLLAGAGAVPALAQQSDVPPQTPPSLPGDSTTQSTSTPTQPIDQSQPSQGPAAPGSAVKTPATPATTAKAPMQPLNLAPGQAPDVTNGGTSLLDTLAFGGNALRPADRTFAQAAVLGNLQAGELGRLAAAKAANPDVKTFGQTLADAADKVHVQLLVAGNAAGITLPGELGTDARATYATLDALSGADFDRAFLDEVAKRGDADLSLFEQEAGSRRAEVNLRKFAAATVPVLQQQLSAAKDLQGKLGAPASGAASGGGRR
jgi:putative membrane protein